MNHQYAKIEHLKKRAASFTIPQDVKDIVSKISSILGISLSCDTVISSATLSNSHYLYAKGITYTVNAGDTDFSARIYAILSHYQFENWHYAFVEGSKRAKLTHYFIYAPSKVSSL